MFEALDLTIMASKIILNAYYYSCFFNSITVITNETHALYEVGGNIFERCLDPGTNMHALTKINPEATWVIKGRVDGS